MKFKRLLAIALSLMVAVTLSSVSIATVFADEPVPSGDGDTAKLVKYFEMDDEVTFPDNAVFKFKFEPANSTASATTPENSYANVPSTAFTAHEYTMSTSDLKAGTTDGGYVLAVAIKDVFDGYDFPHGGVYSFTVTEDKGGTSATVDGGTLTYDDATFTLRMGVKNDGTIDAVTVVKDGEKVDPTDADPTQTADQTAAGPEGFTFDNTYYKLVEKHKEPTEPNPDDPNSDDPEDKVTPDKDTKSEKDYAFSLKKFINGNYADKTKEFNFTVSVTLPKTAATFDYAAEGNVIGDLKLANEEEFAYDTLPVGTIIEVDETDKDSDGYTTVATTSDANNALTIKVTEDGAYAIYQNDFDDNSVTPTGIILNNLPYILLILIALGGIVLFARKRRYQ